MAQRRWRYDPVSPRIEAWWNQKKRPPFGWEHGHARPAVAPRTAPHRAAHGAISQHTAPHNRNAAARQRAVRSFTAFFTSFLLIKYWLYNKSIIEFFNNSHKYKTKIVFFGIASAIALTIHSIFLGIKIDHDLI